MSVSEASDFLIIGAGPAGAFAAMKLSRAGFRVTVLEKNDKPKRKICGEYLCPRGLELLREEGLEQTIVGSFLRLRGMKIVTAAGTLVETDFPSPQIFEGVAVNREVFDANIIECAKAAGSQLITGIEVKSIEKKSEFWSVQTDQGEFLTRVLIGADGRKSLVSKTLENDVAITERRVAIHAFAFKKGVNSRYGEMHLFENGAYVGLNPTGENEVNYSLVVDAEELKVLGGPMGALNHYMAQSKALARDFEPFTDEKKVTATFPIQHRTKTIIPADSVALLGDAAGFVDPLTGEGMYNALLSARLFCNEVIQRSQPNAAIPQQVFLRYKSQYAKVLRQKSTLNRLFQKLIHNPWLVERIAKFLLHRRSRADAFIGIIGNIYTPLQGLLKII